MSNQSATAVPQDNSASASAGQKFLFWGCYISLIATSVAFATRLSLLSEWQAQFNLSGEQVGQIAGAGIWPFAISIILFSLVVDYIGYKTAMIFAFLAHVIYGIIVICAPMALAGPTASPEEVAAGRKAAYWLLYGGSFILGLSNGTVEAVINPVVATMFNKQKVKWLNILHSGWPAGLVLGGLLVTALSAYKLPWQWTIGMIFIPALIYGPMMLLARFPVNERVAAGFSYMSMLKEFGVLASLLVVPLIVRQLGEVFGASIGVQVGISAAIIVGFGAVVRAPGSFMLFAMMLIMVPLATTELGTDGWITALMEQPLHKIGLHPVLVLVYTSFIMMMLRAFAAGPIAHRLNPLGLLAISAALAAVGLYLLSMSAGWAIFAAATVYAFGKTFFWPTMLGVVSEQCPRGGALTLNAVGGMGMLAVGVLGMPFIGLIQDNAVIKQLHAENPALYQQVKVDKQGMYGGYEAVDSDKVKLLADDQKKVISTTEETAKHGALSTMALFPLVMLAAYLAMIIYFVSKGGYKPIHLEGQTTEAAH
jgi:MFS family permease